MELSPEQKLVFDEYKKGNNIFVTGPGGTGKTHLIREIQKDAVACGRDVQVCALTGCAAILLECKAKTVHSWAGIGLGTGSEKANLHRVEKYNKKPNWYLTDLLIIDEVSMMSLHLFDILNFIGQQVRDSPLPFGGIQLIFSGDFYQLPPVPDKAPKTKQFCFESPQWNTIFPQQIKLTVNYRQNEANFLTALNEIRVGKLTAESIKLLETRVINTNGLQLPTDGIKPIKLFPRKYSVERINRTEMAKINEPEHVYTVDVIKPLHIDDDRAAKEEKFLRGNALFDEVVKLKKGAQVMCIANVDLESHICNGSVGVVTNFDVQGYPIVKFKNGVERVMGKHQWASEEIDEFALAQVPLIIAYAVTIHKSQGATVDLMELDVGSGVFECGQTYVGLSRVRSLDGLYIKEFNPQKIKVNARVKRFYAAFAA